MKQILTNLWAWLKRRWYRITGQHLKYFLTFRERDQIQEHLGQQTVSAKKQIARVAILSLKATISEITTQHAFEGRLSDEERRDYQTYLYFLLNRIQYWQEVSGIDSEELDNE